MDKDVEALVKLLEPLEHYSTALSLLSWDQEVLMPKASAEARAKVMGFFAEESHKIATNKKIGVLLSALAKKKLPSLEQAVVREVKESYERATKISPELVRALAEHEAKATMAWREAKAKNKFSLFAPHLERGIDLLKQVARAIDPKKDPYDVLLQGYDEELTSANVKAHLDKVKAGIVPLIAKIQKAKKPKQAKLNVKIPQEVQHTLCKELAKQFGLPEERSRLDISTHPASWWMGDARITTRYTQGFWHALTATAHETGHSLYELGVDRTLPAPLDESMSMVVHESQSRLWENHVLLNKAFLSWFLPLMNKRYNIAYKLDEFYAAVSEVKPGLNRVAADELTYPLHVILRFELEQDLIRGKLQVKDLPKAWNAKMKELLGVTPKTDSEGCLQDIHWTAPSFGYFPQYVLGSMLAAQLYATAKKEIPGLEKQLAKGDTSKLLAWLRENVHKHGRVYTTSELIKQATGKPLSADDYLAHFREKYAIY